MLQTLQHRARPHRRASIKSTRLRRVSKRTLPIAQWGGSLTTSQLLKLTKRIPRFRGVFTRSTLPTEVKVNESAIVNLDNSGGAGTHWVAYKKKGKRVDYFDSYGNLKAPLELVKYFGDAKIYYNKKRYQKPDQTNCGELCLKFLKNDRKPRRKRRGAVL